MAFNLSGLLRRSVTTPGDGLSTDSVCITSYPLDDRRRTHAAASAHRDEAGTEIAPLQFVEHGADEHGAGGADRMPERDGSSVDVYPLRIEPEVPHGLHRNGGERLVDLPE